MSFYVILHFTTSLSATRSVTACFAKQTHSLRSTTLFSILCYIVYASENIGIYEEALGSLSHRLSNV